MGTKQALPPVTARPQKAADLSAAQWGCCTCPPCTALGPRMARGVVSVTSVGPTVPCNNHHTHVIAHVTRAVLLILVAHPCIWGVLGGLGPSSSTHRPR